MFKKRRGIKLSYDEQGLIHFICVNFDKMPVEIKYKILQLCEEIGKEHAVVLFEVMTNSKKNIRTLSREFFVSESSLYRYRQRFYEEW